MNEHARTPLDHLRQQRTVKASSGKKVEIQLLLRKLVRHSGKAARRFGAANIVDWDVLSAEFLQNGLGNLHRARNLPLRRFP